MVRAEGIEPSTQAWEAHVLPLYYARAVRKLRYEKNLRSHWQSQSEEKPTKTGAARPMHSEALPDQRTQRLLHSGGQNQGV